MALLQQEGPVKEVKEVEDREEVLPDGTVHHVHLERFSSVKEVQEVVESDDGEVCVVEKKETVPGTVREDLVETFEEPPRFVHEEGDLDQVLEDGSKVHKHIVMNRMVKHKHTHHESFDSAHGRQEEDFDTEEVIPGTETAFVVPDDCSSTSSSDQ